MSRKVFIDIGAGSGGDIEGFWELDPANKDVEIFAFEVHPKRVLQLEGKFKNEPNVTIVKKAASVSNGFTEIFFGKNPNNSSLNEDKINVDRWKYGAQQVQTLDLCEWIKKNFSKDDHITLLMDIEGHEFYLLPKMQKEGVFEYLDEVYMEFHGRKLEGFDMSIEDKWSDFLIETYGESVYICGRYQNEQFVKLNREEQNGRKS